MKSCSDINELMTGYIDNELDSDRLRMFEEHLGSCESCRSDVEQIKQTVQYCKAISDEELPEGFMEALHNRLVEVKDSIETGDGPKEKSDFIKKRNRYIGIFSSIAAGLLVFVFLRGMTGNVKMDLTGAKAPENSSYSVADARAEEAKAEAAPAESPKAAEVPQKADGGNADENGAVMMNRQSAFDDTQKAKFAAAADGTEKPVAKEESSRGKLSDGKPIVNRYVGIQITSANPEAEKGIIDETAQALGSIVDENAKYAAMMTAGAEPERTDPTINIEIKVPNNKYTDFEAGLRARFTPGNISFGAITVADMTGTVEELNKRALELEAKINSLGAQAGDISETELETVKAEKAAIGEEIQRLIKDSDYTVVKVTIKLKQ